MAQPNMPFPELAQKVMHELDRLLNDIEPIDADHVELRAIVTTAHERVESLYEYYINHRGSDENGTS